MSNVVWLPSEEILLELLGVDHRWEVSLHLRLTLEESLKMLVDLNVISLVVRRFSSGDLRILCCQQNFVKSWGLVSLSAKEEVGTCGGGSLLVEYDGVDFPQSKVNSFGEFILIINFEPFVDVLNCRWLYVLADCNVFKLFLLQNHKIFSSFWWLTELCIVGGFCGVLPKDILCRSQIKLLWTNRVNLRLNC